MDSAATIIEMMDSAVTDSGLTTITEGMDSAATITEMMDSVVTDSGLTTITEMTGSAVTDSVRAEDRDRDLTADATMTAAVITKADLATREPSVDLCQ